MSIFEGLKIGHLLLALGILFASAALTADQAHAHGADGAHHAPVAVQSMDDSHAEQGHPGHCHGGSFCTNVAVFAGLVPTVLPVFTESRWVITEDHFKLLSLNAFDPPPPRLLS